MIERGGIRVIDNDEFPIRIWLTVEKYLPYSLDKHVLSEVCGKQHKLIHETAVWREPIVWENVIYSMGLLCARTLTRRQCL